MKKVTTKNLRATALIALRKLGILDSKGKPKEEINSSESDFEASLANEEN